MRHWRALGVVEELGPPDIGLMRSLLLTTTPYADFPGALTQAIRDRN